MPIRSRRSPTRSGAARASSAFLEMAWRTEIQNHPHDSICGCSVDQVHIDMRYRFDQAAMLAETAVRRAAAACLDARNADAVPHLGVQSVVRRRCARERRGRSCRPWRELRGRDCRRPPHPGCDRRGRTERALDNGHAGGGVQIHRRWVESAAVFRRTVNRFEIATTPTAARR